MVFSNNTHLNGYKMYNRDRISIDLSAGRIRLADARQVLKATHINIYTSNLEQ